MTYEEKKELLEACREKGRPSQVAEGQVHLLLTDVERAIDAMMRKQRGGER